MTDPVALLARLRELYPLSVGKITDLPLSLLGLAGIESSPRWNEASVGDGGESVSIFQVHLPDHPNLGPLPSSGLDQAEWIAPVVRELIIRNAAELTDADIPVVWRHGHFPATKTPLDWARDALYQGIRSKYAASSGARGSAIFLAPAPPAPVVGVKTTKGDPTMDPKKLKDALDKIRKQADEVRKTIDLVAGIVASIPFVGPVIAGYVRTVQLVVDALDGAIDALDDELSPKPA